MTFNRSLLRENLVSDMVRLLNTLLEEAIRSMSRGSSSKISFQRIFSFPWNWNTYNALLRIYVTVEKEISVSDMQIKIITTDQCSVNHKLYSWLQQHLCKTNWQKRRQKTTLLSAHFFFFSQQLFLSSLDWLIFFAFEKFFPPSKFQAQNSEWSTSEDSSINYQLSVFFLSPAMQFRVKTPMAAIHQLRQSIPRWGGWAGAFFLQEIKWN